MSNVDCGRGHVQGSDGKETVEDEGPEGVRVVDLHRIRPLEELNELFHNHAKHFVSQNTVRL